MKRSNRCSANPNRVGLSIPNPLVVVVGRDLPGGVLGLDEVAIFEDLGEPETLLEVGLVAAAGGVNVVDGAEADPRACRFVYSHERIPGPVLVLGVARRPVRVIKPLDHLGTQDVAASRNPEPGLGVEVGPLRRRRLVVGRVDRQLAVLPPEHFWPDLRLRKLVRLVAAVHELEAVVNVVLVVEREAAQDETATIKACHCDTVRNAVPVKEKGGLAAHDLQ